MTEVVNRVLGHNINHCRRENKILFKDRYIKYPFENDLGSLERQDCYDCLIDYLKNDFPAPTNLEEWGYSTFGRSIADKYFLPYNRKIWKTEPREMGLEWVDRVPKPPMEDVVKSALGFRNRRIHSSAPFPLPARWWFRSAATGDDPGRDQGALRQSGPFDPQRRGRLGGPGRRTSWRFDHLVVTIPIHEAIRCLVNVPAMVLEAVDQLRYNAIRVSLVAVNNESLMDKSAVYIPDPGVLPHRVCFMGYFSPNMVRPGTSSLVAETTVRSGDQTDRLSDDDFLDRLIGDLDRAGILRSEDVLVRDTRHFEYAYPVYDQAHGKNDASFESTSHR